VQYRNLVSNPTVGFDWVMSCFQPKCRAHIYGLPRDGKGTGRGTYFLSPFPLTFPPLSPLQGKKFPRPHPQRVFNPRWGPNRDFYRYFFLSFFNLN